MRKEITQHFCDDCGRQMDKPALTMKYADFAETVVNIDFCRACLLDRMNHSLRLVKLDRVCVVCDGKGKTRGDDGHYGNVWQTCDPCDGKGFKEL
jgi:hypothetical protein